MFSCWHSPSHPNGHQMSFLLFFFPVFSLSCETWSTVTRRALALLPRKNHQQWTRKLAPFNESHNCFKVKLHPFKPVLHITRRDAGEKKKKSVYLQFIAEWKPQRQKWDMCKLLWVHSVLGDESSMYKMGSEREGWHNLCPAYLYDTRLWNGKIKGKLFRTKCELSCRLLVTGHAM